MVFILFLHHSQPRSHHNHNSLPILMAIWVKKIWQLWHQHLVILIIKFWSQHYHLCFLLFNQILPSHCTHCLKGKMHHLPFHVSSSQSRGPLDHVRHDVWDLASVTSVNNFHYYLLFVADLQDTLGCFYFIRYLKYMMSLFILKLMLKINSPHQLKSLGLIVEGNIPSMKFSKFFSSHGIIHQFTWPNTPQQNG